MTDILTTEQEGFLKHKHEKTRSMTDILATANAGLTLQIYNLKHWQAFVQVHWQYHNLHSLERKVNNCLRSKLQLFQLLHARAP